MLNYLFMVCQYMDGMNPVMRKVEIVKPIVKCIRDSSVGCGDGYRVVFAHTKPAVDVYQTECLFVTKENKNELTYQR